MALLELVKEEIIRVPLVSITKTDIIRELIEVLDKAGKVNDVETACDAVLTREDQGSTGLEKGIAVPHAKTDAVSGLTLALGLSPSGIDFNAFDGQLSHLFFLLLAPPDSAGPHIEALSEIARMCNSNAFCRMLKSAVSAKEVVEIFREDQ